jgi:hypothetical protein
MENFYLYFFIRNILVLLIFLSNLDPRLKIFIMLALDEFGGYLPFNSTKNSLNLTDRVIIMDTIGSMFCYFQIFVLLIENKILNQNYLLLLIGALFLHIISILNYLKNQATNKTDKRIIPDLFKVVLIGSFLFQ